jgi:hypothetical protein
VTNGTYELEAFSLSPGYIAGPELGSLTVAGGCATVAVSLQDLF